MKKSSFFTLLIIAFVLACFLTPLGDFFKVRLNRIFAASPAIIELENCGKIDSYNWKLKDGKWDFFNFNKSKGNVVFINFWASWHLPSRAQFKEIETLYEQYGDRVDFYLITDEEREPAEEFLNKNKYNLPITYQIIGEPAPLPLLPPPGCYLLDKNGYIRIHQTDISDWTNGKVTDVIDEILAEK
ncbi:redoxin domain-containing protein [Aggregatimonas sangjinii]|uniref:Redoxin domain-containing protein n=1 Tax=Aggregatimonas sangjinii TaxID=2583587 RepID=A0A5B7SPT5_9FLAO|nr:redoxin domain-containing protein [Aggregatimonas sangjinii]QCX00695.1 redoxin domain-containing protein [Aggregatimonas sangjinii]